MRIVVKLTLKSYHNKKEVSKSKTGPASMGQINRTEDVSTLYCCHITGDDRKDEFFLYLKGLPSLNSVCVTYTNQYVNVFMDLNEPQTVNDVALIMFPLCSNQQISINIVSLDYLDSMTRTDWLPLSQNINTKLFSFPCQAYQWVMTTHTFSWMDPFIMENAIVADFLHKLFQELHPSSQ